MVSRSECAENILNNYLGSEAESGNMRSDFVPKFPARCNGIGKRWKPDSPGCCSEWGCLAFPRQWYPFEVREGVGVSPTANKKKTIAKLKTTVPLFNF